MSRVTDYRGVVHGSNKTAVWLESGRVLFTTQCDRRFDTSTGTKTEKALPITCFACLAVKGPAPKKKPRKVRPR